MGTDGGAAFSAGGVSAGMVQGSLCCPEDPKMGERLAFLMGRSSRDTRMYLRKWLREALRQAGIQPKARSKAGASPPCPWTRLRHALGPPELGRMLLRASDAQLPS